MGAGALYQWPVVLESGAIVARWQDNARRDLFQETAAEMEVHPAIAEKDSWVCWILDYLFGECTWKDRLAFKGGTSLSKAFGLIERFSEDIDLVLDWRLLGYAEEEPTAERSATKQDRLGKEANRRAAEFLADTLAPTLRRDLPARVGGTVSVDAREENILIRYPRAFALDAIQPEVRLEIGPTAPPVCPRNTPLRRRAIPRRIPYSGHPSAFH